MKKILLALVPFVLLGCGGPDNIMDSSYGSSPIKSEAQESGREGAFDFKKMAKGKRKFQLAKSQNYRTIFDVCTSYERLNCSIEGSKADELDGVKGYLDSETPVKVDKYNSYYRLVIENGDIYYLQVSNVYENDDVLDKSLGLINLDKKEKYESLIGLPIKDGSSILLESVKSEGKLVYLYLNTGEKVFIEDFEKRIKLLDQIVQPTKFDQAFPVSKDIYADYDDFEQRWWLIPRLRFEMPAYFYAGVKKDGSKWLRATFRYHGSNWIFFDKAAVISGDIRYEREFSLAEGSRDNDSNGVYESADIKVTEKEMKLFESMSKYGAKVRLSGKYQDTEELTEEQRVMLDNLYKLYQLI